VKKLAFIPLDDRPCTYIFPQELAEIAGVDLICPPRDLLGCFLAPGSPLALSFWLMENIREVEALLTSIDMLAYGGLVASRSHGIPLEDVLENLKILRTIALYPEIKIPIYACNALMRAAPTASSAEEVELSQKLARYSYLKERISREESQEFIAALDALKKEIPEGDLLDYFRTRERNYLVNERMIHWTREGVIEYLIIGLDDVPSGGLSISERRLLETLAEVQGIKNKVEIYPGTDEMGLLLLTRSLCRFFEFSPSFFPVYSRKGGNKIIPCYEDESIENILEKQVRASGGKIARDKDEADILLYIHTPDKSQGEAVFQPVIEKKDKILDKFIESVFLSIEEKREVALADLAYANGADRMMISRLRQKVPIHLLSAYAGWNTAGNSLGCAIAHSIMRWLGKRRIKDGGISEERASRMEISHLNFLLCRFLDDWAYQSIIREKVKKAVEKSNLNHVDLGGGSGWVVQMIGDCLREAADNFFSEHFRGRETEIIIGMKSNHLKIGDLESLEVSLPWNRLFEVEIKPEFSFYY